MHCTSILFNDFWSAYPRHNVRLFKFQIDFENGIKIWTLKKKPGLINQVILIDIRTDQGDFYQNCRFAS